MRYYFGFLFERERLDKLALKERLSEIAILRDTGELLYKKLLYGTGELDRTKKEIAEFFESDKEIECFGYYSEQSFCHFMDIFGKFLPPHFPGTCNDLNKLITIPSLNELSDEPLASIEIVKEIKKFVDRKNGIQAPSF